MSELKIKTKLFGADAERVTTQEMYLIFGEINQKIGKYFTRIRLTKPLPTKETHGDIDIVYYLYEGIFPTSSCSD